MSRAIAVLTLSVVGICYAQERKTNDKAPDPAEKKRLASITWDLSRHRLVWVVERGTLDGEDFKVAGAEKYEISPEDAIMEFANEKRGFTENEAASLQRLLDTLSLYCAESVVWWEQGQGTKIDPKRESPKREKVRHKDKNVAPETMVASLRRAVARTLQ